MKNPSIRLAILLFISILPIFSQAQTLVIQASSSTDICSPGCVGLSVVNPISGYTFQWERLVYDCDVQTTPTFAGVSNMINACVTGVYYCISTDSNGNKDTSNQIPVRILSTSGLPSPYDLGNVFCMDSIDLCIPFDYYSSFTTTIVWYKDNVVIPGQSAPTYVASTPGTYRYSLTGACGTISSSSVTLNPVHQKPQIASSHVSPVCSQEQVTFTVTNSLPGYTYIWERQFPNNTYSQIGVGNPFIYTIPPNGNITVRVKAFGGGCSVPTSDSLSLQIQLNIPTVSPSGVYHFCGGTTVILNASPGPISPTGYTFQWYKSGSPINGANQPSYQTTKPGKYEVVISNTCGSRISQVTELIKDTPPTVTAFASSATTVCKTDSVELDASVSGSAPFTYQWKKYGNNIIGAMTHDYLAKTSGKYKVEVIDANGCRRTSNNILVSVLPLPSASITANGATTICEGNSVTLTANSGSGYTYQWKNYSTPLQGAVNQSFGADFTGKFKCLVSNAAGCTRASNAIFVYSFPCPGRLSNDSNGTPEISVSAFPNPSSGKFNIMIDGYNTTLVTIGIYDISGRLVKADYSESMPGLIEVNALPKGVYMIEVKSGSKQEWVKFISTGY